MNAKQRNKNRATAASLWLSNKHKNAKPCPRCGVKGLHWLQMPETLEDIIGGVPPSGFWICSDMYGEDGRRIGL